MKESTVGKQRLGTRGRFLREVDRRWLSVSPFRSTPFPARAAGVFAMTAGPVALAVPVAAVLSPASLRTWKIHKNMYAGSEKRTHV